MLKRISIQLLLSTTLIFSGFGLQFCKNAFLTNFGFIILSLGLIGLFICPIINHIRKQNNTKALGWYLIIFSVVNIIRHFEDWYILMHLQEFIESAYFRSHYIYATGLFIWLLASAYIWTVSIKFVRVNYTLSDIFKNNRTKILLTILIILFVLEIPIFNWHGDFTGQIHGHSFWNNNHIH